MVWNQWALDYLFSTQQKALFCLLNMYIYTYIYTHQLPLVYLFNLVIFLPTRHLITLYNKIIYYILQYIPNTLDVFRKF